MWATGKQSRWPFRSGRAILLYPMKRLSGMAVAMVAAALGGCGQGSLQSGQGKLQVPSTLAFGQVYLGASVQKALSLVNAGNAQLSLNAVVIGSAQLSLASPPSFTLAEGATSSLPVALQATTLGAIQATLSLSGDATAQVQVTADVIADLSCPQSTPCNVQTFDPDQGACVGSPAADGTSCNSGNACLTDQACVGGACLGAPVDCDAGNVCMTPSCDPAQGCQYQDNSSRCQGTNPCEIYYCDPVRGCLSTPASNGTPCSAEIQCVQATVCLNGQCTGLPLPDGTPCVDSKDPCATDARCASGVCHSPTADALQPGDIMWKVVASELSDGDGGELPYDAGGNGFPSIGWRAPAATDDLGNIYLDEWFDGGAYLVSVDVCGHERWTTTEFGPSSTGVTNGRHELGNGIVASWMANQTIIGQSQANGQLLWSFSPNQAGYNLTGFQIGDIALSQDGSFYYAGYWQTPDGDGGTLLYGLIGAVLANGQPKFTVALPGVEAAPPPLSSLGYPLLVDENDNMYAGLNYGTGATAMLSFNQIGISRWDLPLTSPGVDSLSENQGVFLEPFSMTEFNSGGSVLWSDSESVFDVLPEGHSPVVASDGTATVLRYRDGGSSTEWHGSIENYSPNGDLDWTFALAQGEHAVTSQVLDANGILYFGTSLMRIFAIDAHTGAFLWQTTLPSQGPMYPGVLALTPAGSLIASTTRELFSIYAGAPLASSPWPRFRGENANDSCPLPGSSGPSPSP